jgi:2-polyprenyl-3-methyl-5-hydroxy-6-metoxy-1,4-benzoquinol methylase
MIDGWEESAQAWIAEQGDMGDWSRRHVLDPVMLERVGRGGFKTALDIGCGEGRFCRAMAGLGIRTSGIDPTEALIARALKHMDRYLG